MHKVVDGDTIYLDNGEKVRFVGVNTPKEVLRVILPPKILFRNCV